MNKVQGRTLLRVIVVDAAYGEEEIQLHQNHQDKFHQTSRHLPPSYTSITKKQSGRVSRSSVTSRSLNSVFTAHICADKPPRQTNSLCGEPLFLCTSSMMLRHLIVGTLRKDSKLESH